MSAESGTVYNPFLYDATPRQLERFIMVGVCVAGKVARQQQEKFDQFERKLWNAAGSPNNTGMAPTGPFHAIRILLHDRDGSFRLRCLLESVKLGQYTRIQAAFEGLATSNLDLSTCHRDQLCAIKGVGMKTASFFILFTRRDPGVACLDTHILAYMREHGLGGTRVPKVTPGSKRLYLDLEQRFLRHCAELNRIPGELDFEIWLARNRGDKQKVIADQINT